MMFHLLNLDSTQHRYGPRTPAAMSTMALLDAQVAAIVDAVEQAGLAPRTTFFVVSDHGFKPVKRQIRPNAAFMKAGLLEAQDGKIDAVRGVRRARRRTAIVYVTVPDPTGEISRGQGRRSPGSKGSTR